MKNRTEIAVQKAIEMANDPQYGYNNDNGANRWGPDYDCISFLQTAWKAAGVNIVSSGSASFHTGCKNAGFIDITDQVDVNTGAGTRRGDIWVKYYRHAAMMVSSTEMVEAYYNELYTGSGGEAGDQLQEQGKSPEEIGINPWRPHSETWDYVFRYPTYYKDKSTVTNSNAFLSGDAMENNAIYVAACLLDYGWTLQAIAGILGNMQYESTINPGIWENLEEGNLSRGFGLVQWTPASKYIDWATANGYSDYTDIDAQIARIIWELENNEQYYATSGYPETFSEFTQSTATPYYLACAFAWNYERSWTVLYGTESEKEALRQKRGNAASTWYSILKGIDFELGGNNQKFKRMSKLLLYAIGSE